eukprot:11189335-Lingulodinium_polyedra.AAC.1
MTEGGGFWLAGNAAHSAASAPSLGAFDGVTPRVLESIWADAGFQAFWAARAIGGDPLAEPRAVG